MKIAEIARIADFRALIGQEIAISDWVTITQERINQFAEATGDHQWIHVDVERAKREMPGGETIAHGYLLLSLLPKLGAGIYKLAWPTRSINYGSDKVRIVNPVKAGARIRLRQSLVAVEDGAPGAHRITVRQTLEIEGEAKPAMIADTIRMTFT
jgi:acyl dehydratase